MSLKHLITSTCMALVLLVAGVNKVHSLHVTTDSTANVLDAGILVQDISAVVLKIADLVQFIQRNISVGDLGAISSNVDLAESTKGVLDAANVTVPKELNGTAFASATKDAAQMKQVLSELLPPVSLSEVATLTDAEKEERMKKRQAIRNAAIADAYAMAVAYQSKKTNAEQEVVAPAKSSASSADTQHAKQAAANDVGLRRLGELIESNVLTAEMLKLQAAEAIGRLPLDL